MTGEWRNRKVIKIGLSVAVVAMLACGCGGGDASPERSAGAEPAEPAEPAVTGGQASGLPADDSSAGTTTDSTTARDAALVCWSGFLLSGGYGSVPFVLATDPSDTAPIAELESLIAAVDAIRPPFSAEMKASFDAARAEFKAAVASPEADWAGVADRMSELTAPFLALLDGACAPLSQGGACNLLLAGVGTIEKTPEGYRDGILRVSEQLAADGPCAGALEAAA